MTRSHSLERRLFLALSSLAVAAACGSGLAPAGGPHASKSKSAVDGSPLLGTAQNFAVLAGTTVTNAGPSVLDADVGVSPGSAVTGFPPGLTAGTIHTADAVALQAQNDLGGAYDNLAGWLCDVPLTGQDLGGKTLTRATYCFTSEAQLTGTLVLDGEGQSDATFVFQVASKLTVASGASVVLINGASPCNVYWQVGSSATIGTGSTFAGSILALTSIAVQTGASIDGRALARNGAVTLDTNRINASNCGVSGGDGGTGGVDGGTDTDGGTVVGENGECCAGSSLCGDTCFNLTNDANHCGSCEISCSASQVCSGGACTACPPQDTQCKDQCANLSNDNDNCGACGHACPASQICISGSCGPCDGNLCSNVCVYFSDDRNNCGACGNVCGDDQCCTNGSCGSTSADGAACRH